ncbi:hypothetical protein [Streptomyces sp. SCSIO ZS0520]
MDWDTLTGSTTPGRHLVIWTALPGSPTQEALDRMASGTGAP